MKKNLIKELPIDFEAASLRIDDVECWFVRGLQKLLGYTNWRNFLLVIDKAKIACTTAVQNIADHFVDVNKMVELGSGIQRM